MKTLLAAVLLTAGAARATEQFTDKQLAARFPYDLGPAEIDASAYPKAQQDAYAVFAKTCSQCHTLARPINAPYKTREDWKRYITRMHNKTKSVAGTAFSKEDARLILEFLVFDSNIRKVQQAKAFEARGAELRAQFDRVKAERSRRQQERDEKKVKDSPMPGVGVTPQP